MLMQKMLLPVLLCISLVTNAQKDLQLWYTSPANEWTDAMPVGNGRIGAMVFGRYNQERIQMNEESVWAGSKINNNNPQSAQHLPEVQQALFKGDYKKALDLATEYMVGTPPRVRSYQPLGDLNIQYNWTQQPQLYKRSLTLNTGIARTEYTVDGNSIVQEVFASSLKDVMVINVTGTKAFDANIILHRDKDVDEYKSLGGLLYYNGQITDKEDSLSGAAGKHMRFSAAMKVMAADGKAETLTNDTATICSINGTKHFVILVTGATNYNVTKLDTDETIDALSICKEKLAKAASLSITELKDEHVKDHRSFFDRVQFSMGDDANNQLPTNERLAKVKNGAIDRGLIVLYYQFGRYLLMGSSRKPARLPANLQGIWNQEYEAPWNADFHTNINLQMNYWPAETGNLPETLLPLADFVRRLTVPGSVTAKEMYNADGWVLHHLTDAFGRTGVADGVWGVSPMAGPWMTFPLYRHYEFTGDKVYLRNTAYPVIKGSVQFVLDFLIKSPEGYLVTNPSHSPENAFFVPGRNKQETSQLSYATTIDVEIITGLFNNFIQSANALNVDKELVQKVQQTLKQLPPIKISAKGTIQEWIQDFEETEPGHRHMSHLLGLYPLNIISPRTPDLFVAAQKTIERRLANGGGHTGWSKAWIINFYARLLNGNEAGKQVQSLLQKSTLISLLSTHPPFQIDGNFGGSAGIAEMLLQSQNNEIHVLPALPETWPSGSIKGLCGRGGYSVDITWNKGNLTSLVVKAAKAGKYTIRYKNKVVQKQLGKGANVIRL
jgi:alpha-L-fucosidase 2